MAERITMINEFQIECFMSVVKNHSFSATAEEKFLSQPSISKHIKNLETSLGGELFIRKNNQFDLTDYGEAMYDLFKRYSEEYNAIRSVYCGDVSHETCKVHIAFLQASDYYKYLQKPFEKFTEEYPYYSLTVSFHSFSALSNLLNSKKCDCAVFPESFIDIEDGLEYKELITLNKCIYYPKKLFKDCPKPTSLDDFKDHEFVLTDEFKKGNQTEEFLSHHNFTYRPKMKYVADIDNMVWNIRYNSCVAIMDSAVTSLEQDEEIESMELDVQTSIVLAWAKDNNNKKVAKFIKQITEDYF